MTACPKCGSYRMSSPTYCSGDGSCGVVGCGSEHLISRCSCGYAEKSPTADAKKAPIDSQLITRLVATMST